VKLLGKNFIFEMRYSKHLGYPIVEQMRS